MQSGGEIVSPKELNFKCEKYLGGTCYSSANLQTLDKAHSYATGCPHYRVIERSTGKEVFNRDYTIEHVPERFL